MKIVDEMHGVTLMTQQRYDEPMRLGQLNLKEDDPRSLDVALLADYWQGNRIDGIAFYPTTISLHYRALSRYRVIASKSVAPYIRRSDD